MGQSRSASKHEYDKPQLKQQIDAAMAAYLERGNAVQRVPSVVVQEPPVLLPPSVPATPVAAKAKGRSRPVASEPDAAVPQDVAPAERAPAAEAVVATTGRSAAKKGARAR